MENQQGVFSFGNNSNTKLILSTKNALSTFEFNSFTNKISFGDLGPGSQLLAFNMKTRLLAVGVSNGIYILSTFDLHVDLMICQNKKFNYRKISPPHIKLRSSPLKIQFSEEGDLLGVLTSSGTRFYKTKLFESGTSTNEYFLEKEVDGNFRDFAFSRKGFIGLLGHDEQFRIMNTLDEKPKAIFSAITSFSFSYVGGRVMLGTRDGTIVLYHLINKRINTTFCLPGAMRQPVLELIWFSFKFCFFGLLSPRDRFINNNNNNNKKMKSIRIRGCILKFSKKINTFDYTSSVKLFTRNLPVTKENEERKFICNYFDHWNALCVTSPDCNSMEIFEEYDDGWFPLIFTNSKLEKNVIKNGVDFFDFSQCRGFTVDWSWRMAIDKKKEPVSPMLVFLTSDGDLVFREFLSKDENYRPRKYDPLESFEGNEEKKIYTKQWKGVSTIIGNMSSRDIEKDKDKKDRTEYLRDIEFIEKYCRKKNMYKIRMWGGQTINNIHKIFL